MTIRQTGMFVYDDSVTPPRAIGIARSAGVVDYFPFVTAQPSSTPAAMLGDLYSMRVLFVLLGANMNSTADQAFTKVGSFTGWTPTTLSAVNASGNVTTAAGGVYSAAAKGGNALVGAAQVYTGLTTSVARQVLSLDNLQNGLRTETPILSLTTPQGSAMTADFYLVGTVLS